ncbi:putative Zinc-binding alcohol dehydrogenase domain-containing protein cipB [Glarea lozoyensis 74030]|uniref:Putative Zinc-binding alcohol dehydrogenase domain-containing protein cipB n=1 Tax=Glarea lozoyensis (strain ATCC 74030 / MF5533) TaxID=1104152 RepID=H0ENP9_GLAL7|nr:putative Zinc-binding alcohol dehydrogenase domain-containing protein cipB [Glarea lozoyensis 74030]
MSSTNENLESVNLAAVLETAKARVTLQERPIPKPGPDELLVRNKAIAANPADWKIQDYDFFVDKYPNVLGSDACGYVVDVGNAVTRFKKGDRVTGFAAVIYNSNIDHGAWQTYTILREIATSKIPDSMSFAEGSVFPMAFATACNREKQLEKFPRPPAVCTPASSTILVWGGSSSVGSAAVQIAKAIGLHVWATASPSNHDFVKSMGATRVFDYHSPNVVSDILSAAQEAGIIITKVFDAISEKGSLELASGVLADGGEMAIVLDWPTGTPQPPDIAVSLTVALRTGKDCEDVGAWFFNEWLEEAMEMGTVVPTPKIQIVDGGIEVTQKVFDMLKAGVSATKLVVLL